MPTAPEQHSDHHLIYRPQEEGLGELTVDRFLTIPNAITFVRMLCIPLFLYLLFGRRSPGWAGFLLGSLGATDWIDGYVARRFNQRSNFGTMFDPTVDRLLIVVGIVAVIIDDQAPAWFSWLILVREVMLSTFVVVITAMGAKRMDVTWWGKCGTFAIMGAFPSFMISNEPTMGHTWHIFWQALAYCCAVPGVLFSILAALQYFRRGPAALAEGRADRMRALSASGAPSPPGSHPGSR
ncbi:MAG: CDP-diacylglycerol--glycerol-3-phosphate 3-phosphatidyltransferase [Microthrixaceae bacterium]